MSGGTILLKNPPLKKSEEVMSIFFLKSLLALLFLLVGIIAVLCMFALMGKTERKISAVFLRRMHKIAGFIFAILFLILSYFCIKYVAVMGDTLSIRAVIHGVLALGLFVVLLLKISIVQFYKQFLRYAPALGMTVFALAFGTFCTSAGFFFLASDKSAAVEEKSATSISPGDIQVGEVLFEKKCSFCHYADRTDSKLGPGLKNVLKNKQLPASQKPATRENVKEQLINPYRNMPSFKATLSEQDIKDLLAYLETL